MKTLFATAAERQFAAVLGARIASGRARVGLTQGEVARLLGDGSRAEYVRALESGYLMPSVFELWRISRILGTTPGRLLRGLELPLVLDKPFRSRWGRVRRRLLGR